MNRHSDMRSPSLYQEGKAIRVITAPFFLRQRWKRFEEGAEWTSKPAMILNFVAVIEGRVSLLQEIAASPGGSSGLSSRSSKDPARGVSISRCASWICLGG